MHEREAQRVKLPMSNLPPAERERVATNEDAFDRFATDVLKGVATAAVIEIIKRILGLSGVVRFK